MAEGAVSSVSIHELMKQALRYDNSAVHSNNSKQEIIKVLRSALEHTSKNGKDSYRTYASIEDPAFQSSLLSKREFYEHRVPEMEAVKDFANAAEQACSIFNSTSSSEFRLSESQSFVRNFLSPTTPYNGILLFHDVGVGKTCSAISIAEQFDDRHIIVLAPHNVQQAFRSQIFDAKKVSTDANGMAISNQCTQLRYTMDLSEGADMETHAQRLINQKYTFKGYHKFGNTIFNMSDSEIQKTFKKHIIIVDEVHNLRSQRVSGNKFAYKALVRVLKLCQGTKLILLTATPMFNDAREIVDIINLLLINDARPILKRSKIFADDGKLLDAMSLSRACIGYVSHVSGRNPLRFPIMLNPKHELDTDLMLRVGDTFSNDIAGNPIPKNHRIQKTQLIISHMHPKQYHSYIGNISGAVLNDNQVSRLGKDDDVAGVKTTTDEDEDAETIDDEVNIANTLKAVGNMVEFQEEVGGLKKKQDDVILKEDDEEEDIQNHEGVDDDLPATFRPGFEVSNIMFPVKSNDVKNRNSSTLFWNCFRRLPGKEFSVEYAPEAGKNGGFLSVKHLSTYSCKFDAIIKRIISSTGIVFVYSRFLWAGLIPLAIALEQQGFKRYGSRRILGKDPTSGNGIVRPVAQTFKGNYILLTSDSRICTRSNFNRDLGVAVSNENSSGSNVRVILACGVATEGIDFKCVRSLHLLDPWYHSNKVAQIIGRASRNCSHAALPVEQRNVTVYLHAAVAPKNLPTSQNETVDLNAYRISEMKQTKINVIEDILKSISVDCDLNRHSQQDKALALATLDIITCQGKTLKKYNVGKDLAASSKTCIVDTLTRVEPGSDTSTYDPWRHSITGIDETVGAIVSILEANHSRTMDINDIKAMLTKRNSVVDETIFLYALQKGIDQHRILYRGGVYLIPTRTSSRVCRVMVPITHASSKVDDTE